MAITERNKKILIDINYAHKVLTLDSKFINLGNEIKTFNKTEILKIFKELNYNCKYLGQGCYDIRKNYKNYSFQLFPKITQNRALIYIYI